MRKNQFFNHFTAEFQRNKLRKLEKEVKSKLSTINRIAWKIRNEKVVRKLYIKYKQYVKKDLHWQKLNMNAIEKIMQIQKIAQIALDELKVKTDSITEINEELSQLSRENASTAKVKY